MPNTRPRFGGRLMTVGATWGVLAVIAVLAGPVPAMLLSLIPLMMALRAALRADARGEPPSMEQALQRQVTAAAMLIAVGLFAPLLVAHFGCPGWPGEISRRVPCGGHPPGATCELLRTNV
ncbi:MAG: hypothetical protein K0R39_3894 [Symbiobacteriaceae bacterium]|nr:hypothetical protein [Symbiobacteriaceae bacterium]